MKVGEAFLTRNDFAIGRQNGRNGHEIKFFDSRVAKGHLKRCQLLLMPSDSFGKKNIFGNHTHMDRMPRVLIKNFRCAGMVFFGTRVKAPTALACQSNRIFCPGRAFASITMLTG